MVGIFCSVAYKYLSFQIHDKHSHFHSILLFLNH